jgi:hypothetical protein
MRKPRKQYAFAAVYSGDPNFILPWTVCSQAKDVRKRVAENWPDDGGWEAAKANGYRVVKIELRAAG